MRSLQRRLQHAMAASAMAAAVLVAASPTVSAAPVVRNVPGAYPTIQSAINAAVDGDTVLVAPGTYRERIGFRGKAIKVKSAAGAAVTVIDAGQKGPVVTFKTGEPRGAILNGFTVRNGIGLLPPHTVTPGAGINIINASPTVKANVIEFNVEGQVGAGVGINGGDALIQNNTIQHNEREWGAGLGVRAGAPVIVDNIIQDNSTGLDGSFGGGLAWFGGGDGVVRNNIIRRNSSTGSGGGVWVSTRAPRLILAQNLITDNVVNPPGGGFLAQQGGGVYWALAAGYVVNNTIANNHATHGTGIYFGGVTPFTTVMNNIVTADEGTSVIDCGMYRPTYVPYLASNNVFGADITTYAGDCAAGPIGPDNISGDPQFLDAGAGDYHLAATSPSIDAGDNTAPGLTAWDLDGNPRRVGGTFAGVVDQGVYEFQP